MRFDFDLLKAPTSFNNHILIIYDPIFGYSCPDGLIARYVDNLAENFEAYVKEKAPIFIGSELLITGIRVAVFEGRIPFDQVAFFYDRFAMYIDKDGRIDHWPRGFCDHNDKFLAILLDWNTQGKGKEK